MNNITQDKGDIGVAAVISDLTKKGIKIALPISQHLPFDIIAISEAYSISRISVKYISIQFDALPVPLRTISSNSQGYKIKRVNFDYVDAFAIFCPETSLCYYIHKKDIPPVKSSFSLRTNEIVKNNHHTRLAKDFLNHQVLFK